MDSSILALLGIAFFAAFGLSRVLMELKLAQGAFAYGPMVVAGLLDAWLLYRFFSNVHIRQHRPAAG